jgi:magnesium chelatase subunit D
VTSARYPFAAVPGRRAATHALMLLAVEPQLRGTLIASAGSAEDRILARAFGALLYGVAPPRFTSERSQLREDHFEASEVDGAVVELPVNATEDRLLGGLDLERTIETGRPQISAGLLARANGRVLYVDDINLLNGISAHIGLALDSRVVRVEREGMSAIHGADFTFVGMFDRDEGCAASLLRDRVGLIVDTPAERSADDRAETVDRAFRFDRDPFAFVDDFAFETAQLLSQVEDGRARLPLVSVSLDRRRQISQIAVSLGVEGNRADLFALKAARANAALAGRDSVTDDDVVIAIQFVLAPRATMLPSQVEHKQSDEASPADRADEDSRPDLADSDRDLIPGAIEDAVVEAIDARVPRDLLSASQGTPRSSRAGKRFKATIATRGRYVRSATDPPRDSRVAVDATLRAAAPFQFWRRVRSELNRSQSQVTVPGEPGSTSRRVKIEPRDLRFKEFKRRSGILFIFAVDASGSMALNRMAQAKGALTRLLQQAYLHRDKVALISFRGERSDVLLAPTRSVEMAKRLVDALPAGGGTPLSAALVSAIDLARFARLRGTPQTMLVLFTDGRANVGLGDRHSTSARATIGEEIGRLGVLLGAAEISSVVVDTKSRFVSSGEGEALARMLGARYFYLPRSDAASVCDAIRSNTRRPREN